MDGDILFMIIKAKDFPRYKSLFKVNSDMFFKICDFPETYLNSGYVGWTYHIMKWEDIPFIDELTLEFGRF